MKAKLKCVMLIDDNEGDNFYHSIIIEENAIAHKIITFEDPTLALQHLLKTDKSGDSLPELILLDINMTKMDGWEFLHAYQALSLKKQQVKIIMLTTSLNPEDKEKCLKHPDTVGFFHKPLSKDTLHEILKTNFQDIHLH